MVTIVLDASALLRRFVRQGGADRVLELLELGQLDTARIVISAVNWGEVISKVDEVEGRTVALALTATLMLYGVEVVPAGAERAENAAFIKRDKKLGYADAFCVELAASIPGAKLITADFDFLKVIDLASIEFLPKNPLPAVQP